ncbi:SDR family NAD(P)-dependent oxidoreductase [Cytobacillus horneckiae]|uniref:NAD(P)-dependent oxidoreductase n=1 Tax=Cytobacillus horneckiae TaxID=549687 RepID=A0A2N0ZAU3_9BACI|nr:SDR family NAD(P)-dependent oxidoreductase [Cytobacillus horneckiae]MEC1157207.1 SDR family NAD(P)-dependent oxidoreductase [Cytobacillus horneckiae]MED2938140.1 SDR family NAD(P)-dependent oxidoreductase [Cytobacillus horneckiae]PKG26623.1 NAD(P)-dependent oxidoreductase [Cytobacillus horneckiae]
MEEKVVFITGAGRGMGREIAKTLSKKSAKIVVTDVNLENAQSTVSLIEENGGEATAVYCDVTSLESVQNAVESAIRCYRRIDILVNNAGWDKIEPFLKSEPSTWKTIIDINLMGQIHTCKEILPHMINNGYGKVINIASDSGRVGSSGEGVYSAAKGGVIALTKTLAREMARHKLNVNCIAPGPADTPLFQEIGSYNEGIAAALQKAIPFRRLAEPSDIAHAVAYFASDEAAYITGQTLSVNGGLTMC